MKKIIIFLLIIFNLIYCSKKIRVNFNNLKQIAEIQAKIEITIEKNGEPEKVFEEYGINSKVGIKAFGEAVRKFGIDPKYQRELEKSYQNLKKK